MQHFEHSNGSKEDMGQKRTDPMVQSQNDGLVVLLCQQAYGEAQQSVQFVPDGQRIGSFQASFCDPSECSNYISEKSVEDD